MRRFILEICRFECVRCEKLVKILFFCALNLGEGPRFFGVKDICKFTPLLTYWPVLVEIP